MVYTDTRLVYVFNATQSQDTTHDTPGKDF